MKYGAQFERRGEILRRQIRRREIRRRENKAAKYGGDSKDALAVENGSGAAIELRPGFKVFVLTIRT